MPTFPRLLFAVFVSSCPHAQHATLWRHLDLESSAARLDSHALFAIAGGNLLSETRSMCLAGACVCDVLCSIAYIFDDRLASVGFALML
jgi:hypothetical protein